MEEQKKIPQVIHYCWFGKGEMPETAVKCIESWKKYCPNYKIIKWDETNFDINCCTYVRQAYECKKWAFVSDYARFYILYHFGGIYFDTDVELIKPIDDIISRGPFMGTENKLALHKIHVNDNISTLGINVATGLGIAAYAGMSVYAEILQQYQNAVFLNRDQTMNQKTVVETVSQILAQYPIDEKRGYWIKIGSIFIYDKDFFCPLDYTTGLLEITANTRSIHHYDASWFTKEEKEWLVKKYKFIRLFGSQLGGKIWNVFAFARQMKLHGFREAINLTMKKLAGK